MDKRIKIEIDKSQSDKTVKYILENILKISGAAITALKKDDDGILINGKKVFVTYKVKEGNILEILMRDGISDIPPSSYIPDVLYEDEEILVVNKPRMMPTHPSQRHYFDTLANGVVNYYKGFNFVFRAITRLDRDTSGIVLIAKNPLSAAILSESMKRGEIKKEYCAVVNGIPNPLSGKIDAPIKRFKESVILRCVAHDGKRAVTYYEVASQKNSLSYVKLIPETGRTHQLRVHLSYIGNPIYGDDLYGAPQTGRETLLHCRKISFAHPVSGETILLEAPLPDDMKELI